MPLDTQLTLTTTPMRPFDPATLGFVPKRAQLQLTGTSARYLYQGTTPTAAVGFIINDGGGVILQEANIIESFRIVAVSGTGVLQIAVS